MSNFHLQSELESQVYDKLASMLQCMEAHEQNADVDRVNELIKVRVARYKSIEIVLNQIFSCRAICSAVKSCPIQ